MTVGIGQTSDIDRAFAHHDGLIADQKLGHSEHSSKDRTKGIETTFEGFMKIFIATLESQTPDNPADPKEMASMLLSYAQTQETQAQTDVIREMKQSYDNAQLMMAANQVGKVAQVKSNTFEYDPNEANAITYKLPEGVKDVQVVISRVEKRKGGDGQSNDMGVKLTQVAAFNPPKFEAGKNDMVWNGQIADKNRAGKYVQAERGTYHISIIAKDKDGKEFHDEITGRVKTSPIWVTGVVTGASKEGGRPCIKIGESTHEMNTVVGFEGRKGALSSAGYDSGTIKELSRLWESERAAAESEYQNMRANLSPLDLHGL